MKRGELGPTYLRPTTHCTTTSARREHLAAPVAHERLLPPREQVWMHLGVVLPTADPEYRGRGSQKGGDQRQSRAIDAGERGEAEGSGGGGPHGPSAFRRRRRLSEKAARAGAV